MVAPVKITWDEKPVAEGGKVVIKAFDPYSEDNTWTAKDSQGNEYTGAEVTSEGFEVFGLDPYKYYSAGYACYFSNPNTLQDSFDIWDNNMAITNVQNGHRIGYKYFGFGGLSAELASQYGLKPLKEPNLETTQSSICSSHQEHQMHSRSMSGWTAHGIMIRGRAQKSVR